MQNVDVGGDGKMVAYTPVHVVKSHALKMEILVLYVFTMVCIDSTQ